MPHNATPPAVISAPDRDSDWASEAEARVLAAARRLAPELGWGRALTAAAVREAGMKPADGDLLLPQGPRDLAALFSRYHDHAALERLTGIDPAALKVRERIRRGVEARVDVAADEADAVRRCTAFLALPANAGLGASLVWESADTIWRWAGDKSTDENHYTKRAILTAILVNTLATRLDHGPEAASALLDRRIDQVMRFEKWKAGLPKPSEAMDRVAGALARLRYR
jgi:ubiquinone biosynthesis protein COQ9